MTYDPKLDELAKQAAKQLIFALDPNLNPVNAATQKVARDATPNYVAGKTSDQELQSLERRGAEAAMKAVEKMGGKEQHALGVFSINNSGGIFGHPTHQKGPEINPSTVDRAMDELGGALVKEAGIKINNKQMDTFKHMVKGGAKQAVIGLIDNGTMAFLGVPPGITDAFKQVVTIGLELDKGKGKNKNSGHNPFISDVDPVKALGGLHPEGATHALSAILSKGKNTDHTH